MASVGLIVPSWHYFSDPFKLQPLNELYFATVLDDYFAGDLEVSIIDLRETRRQGTPISPENIGTIAPEKNVYAYWIAKSADFPEIISVMRMLRHIYPQSIHVAGGTHVEVFPDECSSFFDAIIIGPGEESLKKIINNSRKGIIEKVYKTDWKDYHYSLYPFPRRTYLPENAVVNSVLFEKYGGVKATSVMFSRGCNFKCAYCVYNIPHTIQMRTPEQIRNEILYLKSEYGIEGVNLRDEICVPLDPKVAIPYLEAIGSTNVLWRGQTRIGASHDTLKLARQTGCVELALGVESVSQQVLDAVQKGQKVEDAKGMIIFCKKLGIKIKMCLILGLPGEPPDILDKTIRFIEDTQPDYVNVSGFCPMPGSVIFHNKGEFGIKYINDNWSKHAHLMMRYSDEEHFGLPFEYEANNKWGKTLSNSEITSNIKRLQSYLRNNGMSY